MSGRREHGVRDSKVQENNVGKQEETKRRTQVRKIQCGNKDKTETAKKKTPEHEELQYGKTKEATCI
jgi:hypothetical protein